MKRLAGKKSSLYLPQMGVAATEWELPPRTKIICKKGLSKREMCSGEEESRQHRTCKGQSDHVNGNAGPF